jgi:G3E family GTPase
MTVTLITLSGFLGAGKTTTMLALATALQRRGQTVAVITNDQGTELVDTKLVRSQLNAVAEVTGGCFCCRFEDLMTVVDELIDRGKVDTVIAEAVGSCTDLQATVVRPLRTYHGDRFTVAPLVTVVDPWRLRAFRRAAERGEPESDLSYLFGRQLAEAEIIAVNKADTIGATDLAAEVATLSQRFPDTRLITYSARTAAGVPQLVDALDGEACWLDDLDVDYDRYAAAEAQLAWLNQRFDVISTAQSFSPLRWGNAVLSHLAAFAERKHAIVGHAKLTIDTPAGMTKLSITGTSDEPSVDLTVDTPISSASAILNARVSCEPEVLDAAVLAAVEHADRTVATRSIAADANSFRPSYPQPVHRLTAAEGPRA